MQNISVVGLSHHTAPVEVREKLSFTPSQIRKAHQYLKNQQISENLILFTCNRTELYLLCSCPQDAPKIAIDLFGYFKKLSPSQVTPILYHYQGSQAVQHLFRVACGLDSMVVGETQILGQLKEAYQSACDIGTTDKVFHSLFQQAFKTGKRVHQETGINDHASSVSYIAVKLAQEILGSLDNRKVLVIGAGEMSELTLKHLLDGGASGVLVVNRTRDRARELADKFAGRVLDFSQIQESLKEADIVITSTGAPHYVIHPYMIDKLSCLGAQQKLFLIDLAVPRDVDPAVCSSSKIHLYDIDDLQEVVAANQANREREAEQAASIINEEISNFMEWYRLAQIEPVIAALREKGEQVWEKEKQEALSRLSHLSPKERKIIETMGKRIMNQLVKDPILWLKEMAKNEQGEEASQSISRAFGISPYQEESDSGSSKQYNR